MKKSVKYVVVGLVILAVVVGGIFYVMMPLPVRMTEVFPQVAELSFMEQGVVSAGRTVLVFPAAQGEISELHVREGQHVSAGEPLVSVDDAGLHLRLEQVQSRIRGLEAQLANVAVEAAGARQTLQATLNSLQGELRAIDAQAELSSRAHANQAEVLEEQVRIQQVLIDRHQNELERTQETFNRVETLYREDVVPRVEFDSAETAVAAAQAQLEAAQAQMAVILAGAGLDDAGHFEGIRASINAQIYGITQQLAQDTTSAARANFEAMIAVEQLNITQIQREIENAEITAPVGGIITTLHAQHTNVVNAASPVAEIAVDDGMEINVYVSTQDIGSINVGDTVALTFRQRVGDIEFYGRVVDIDSAAVVRFTALGVEERKVSVTIEPDIPAGAELGVGFAVDVTFFVFREEGQLIVPRTAVFRADGVDMVWVVIDGIAEEMMVVTGTQLRTDVVIEQGLSPGDFVINDANNPDLSDGVRVVMLR